MKKILDSYEKTIAQLTVRISELKEQLKSSRLPVSELNIIKERIELLQTEKYDLMFTAAQIRTYLEEKPLTPSLAARKTEVEAS